MASIEQIIQREINPFDTVTFRTGNFWQEQQNSNLTVESIHRQELDRIIQVLDRVGSDHQTRTILLCGERGSGKSYLLSRLKKLLNYKAFFGYIGPWADSDRLWRHVLRYTVDSLTHSPENEQESQLLLWLKSLSVLRDRATAKQLVSARGLFILNLRSTYPTGIYQPKDFFSSLYALINPQLNPLACDWLRGEDIDEEDLKLLAVKRPINTEDAAQNILSNFGKIATDTKPIVLCFDQLDKLALSPDGVSGLQPLFTINSTIHNEKLKNFLIIISLVTETWQENKKHLIQADLDRLDQKILLKDINLIQAETIWAKRLFPLHDRAIPQPKSAIYPLNTKTLEEEFPGGKTNPRDTLKLGRKLLQEYKIGISRENESNKIEIGINRETKSIEKQIATEIASDNIAAFKLIWKQEFTKTQQKVTQIKKFSSPGLIKMLQEALNALEIQGVTSNLLTSRSYKSYSLSYQRSPEEKIGIVWTEDANMATFFYVMLACQKAIERNLCQTLYLIRSEKLGNPKNKGYKLYQQVFVNSDHIHIIPELKSIYYLATYHSLVNAVCAGELVVGDTPPNIKQLESFIRDSQVLNDCPLIQKILNLKAPINREPVKEFLLNIIKTQQVMGLTTLIQTVCSHFSQISETRIEQLIQELSQENIIKILNEGIEKEAQLVFLIK